MPYRFIRKVIIPILVLLNLNTVFAQVSNSIYSRGRKDAWVFRSVLDGRARMVSIALHPKIWMSYDANLCKLYKTWPSGVLFEGTIFNQKHGPQPKSVGNYAFTIDETADSVWLLFNSNGEKVPSQIAFKGYKFKNDQVFLHYELVSKKTGEKVLIEENPEYAFQKKTNAIGITRSILVKGLPSGYKLQLQMQCGSMKTMQDISSSSPIDWKSKEEKYNNNQTTLFAKGTLTWLENGVQSFTNYFTQIP